jgi:hypothetical protein
MPAALRNVVKIPSRLPGEIGSVTQSSRNVEEILARGRIESQDGVTRIGQPTGVHRGDEPWRRNAVQTCGRRDRESRRFRSRRIGHKISKHGRLFGQFVSRKPFKKDVVAQ